MTAQHTPGRLTTDEAEHDVPYQNIRLMASGHRTVAIVWIDDAPVRDFNSMQAANARRLVACWNACEGIDTKVLEDFPLGVINAEHARVMIERTRQRDELLAVVKGLMLYFESANSVPVAQATIRANSPWVLDARAAIAKATGGAA